MSKNNVFQDCQFPELSDNRKKIDFQLIETVDPGHIDNANDMLQHRERNSCLSESAYDLRKSLAWDSAFFNSPGVLEPEELFETLNIQLADNGLDMNGQRDFETKESARMNDIDDVRKSLAWDSAFFTSAGVLDAEELAVINRGFKRPESLLLSGVEDKIWRSAESNSKVNSDGCSLASLEIDLFDDIRASIREARYVSSNGSKTCKLEKEKGRPNGCASKKSDVSSQIRHAGSSGKSIPSSSRKPPKISGHANSSPIVPSKRPVQVKMDDKATKSATGQKMPVPKKMCLRESCDMLSSSMLSIKSPYSVLPAARNEYAGLRYASADCTGRSRANRQRRNDSQMAVSVSSFRTPSKYSIRKNTESMNSSGLFSTPKSSPYTSPDSSIDAWSSEPSAASVKQRSNSSASDASKTSDSARHHLEPRSRHKTRESEFLNPQINDISMFTSPAPTNVSTKVKPSGLRVPSPKIGYFDPEKSVGLAQNVGLKFQSRKQGSFPKTGSGIGIAKSTIRPRAGENRLAGSLTRSVSKSGMKYEGKICSRGKKQPFKAHGYIKANDLGEHNKENLSMENHVDYLSQRIGAINFSKDFVTLVKENKGTT